MVLDPNELRRKVREEVTRSAAILRPEELATTVDAVILAYLQHAGEGEAEPVGSDANKLKLWFFRDLTDDERLKLFRLHGLPIEELRTLASQHLVFGRLFAAPHPHQVPEGMVLVPREPTEAMIDAGRAAFDRPGSGGKFSEVYRAMLAASPSQRKGGE